MEEPKRTAQGELWHGVLDAIRPITKYAIIGILVLVAAWYVIGTVTNWVSTPFVWVAERFSDGKEAVGEAFKEAGHAADAATENARRGLEHAKEFGSDAAEKAKKIGGGIAEKAKGLLPEKEEAEEEGCWYGWMPVLDCPSTEEAEE